ncbi:hypothetical protein AB1N83_006966 [Pleurotus pulmonarius]|nr:hypothetical protein EYR36_006972 [Pleurotus pulmonarius]
MEDFPALPGFYKTLFLHIEPFSTVLPAVMIWFSHGASWFHHELIPSFGSEASGPFDPRTKMAVWQLGNCYFLLSLLSSLVFRAVRAALKGNPAAQEQVLGASFLAMAIADVTHIVASIICLPGDLRLNPASWNATTHGNITFVIFLCAARVAWFLGVGRTRYYYGHRKLRPA